jgi:hypothetical protein
MPTRLTFSPVSSNNDYDLSAFFTTDEDNALLKDDFVVTLQKGVRYDMISQSWFDPIYFRVTDLGGKTLASDTGYLGTYGDDYILNFYAPYTGDFMVRASWDQGSFYSTVSLGVFGDIDAANIPTAFGPVNRIDGFALFDRSFYLQNNPDVKAAAVDPLVHYMTAGWREGRDPNAWFDTDGYLAANPDIRAAGINPLEHYGSSGWKEGRDPSKGFDVERYLTANPDIRKAGVDPLSHWIDYGRVEGRSAPETAVGSVVVGGFDKQYYLMTNADVAKAGVDPLTHYRTSGWKEGRDPNPWFDSDGYLAKNSDVRAAGVNPLDHYMASGWKEGRDPSVSFDTGSYLQNYADVRATGANPLEHYLLFGHLEGRQTFGDGTWL